MANKKKPTQYNVTMEQVFEAWQTSDSADEAAKKLKMPKLILLARISSYRKAGAPLKQMQRQRQTQRDPEKMAKLIAQINKKHGLPTPPPAQPKEKVVPVSETQVRSVVQQVLANLTKAQ